MTKKPAAANDFGWVVVNGLDEKTGHWKKVAIDTDLVSHAFLVRSLPEEQFVVFFGHASVLVRTADALRLGIPVAELLPAKPQVAQPVAKA